MQQGREWTPAVVVKQHQAPRSYIVVYSGRDTDALEIVSSHRPDMGANQQRVEPSPLVPSITYTEVEINVAKSQPDTSQADQPVRRSQRIQRAPQVIKLRTQRLKLILRLSLCLCL